MKIAIITEYFPESENCEVRGGVEARAFYFARELAKEHSVSVICSRLPGQQRQERFLGMTVYRCGIARAYAQGGSILSRFLFLWAAIWKGRSLEIDVVDGYNFIAYLAVFFTALGKKSIRKVATYHDVWVGEWIKNMGLFSGLVGEVLERLSLRISWDRIIAVSEYTKNKLITQGIDPQKITVIPNGVDIEEYESVQVKKFKNPTIIYVGRLVGYKRVDDLLRAIKVAKTIVPNVQCKIIGSGPEEEKLKALVRELDISTCIEFLGFVPKRRDVISLMKCSHIFCLPSLVEGFGMVTVEALAAGVPYVNSDIPATREITEGGIGGLLFKPLSIFDLAEKLTKLLQNAPLREQKAQEGKMLSQRYDWQKIVHEIEKVYLQL